MHKDFTMEDNQHFGTAEKVLLHLFNNNSMHKARTSPKRNVAIIIVILNTRMLFLLIHVKMSSRSIPLYCSMGLKITNTSVCNAIQFNSSLQNDHTVALTPL